MTLNPPPVCNGLIVSRYFSPWLDTFLCVSYLISSCKPVLYVPLVLFYFYLFFLHLSLRSFSFCKRKRKSTFMLEYSKNGQVSEGLSLHSLFSKPTLSLADISEVFCVKCEGRDSPVPPPPAPTESGQLFNTLCPSLSAFFFPYQM